MSQLARTNPAEALTQARRIAEPWFRAQALSWGVRFTTEDPVPEATEATTVYDALQALCSTGEHWCCRRAIRDGGRMLSGDLQPRPFYW